MRSWLRSFGDTGQQVYGEPDEWEFDYPWEFLQVAYWLWHMSDYKHLPTPEEVAKYDPRYISDMKLMVQIGMHQRNSSPLMRMLDQWQAYNADPAAYKAQLAASEISATSDAALLKTGNKNPFKGKP